jgi:hypothetical protein
VIKKKTEKRGERRREPGRDVEFIFHAPEAAEEVYLTGEFNWDTCSLL